MAYIDEIIKYYKLFFLGTWNISGHSNYGKGGDRLKMKLIIEACVVRWNVYRIVSGLYSFIYNSVTDVSIYVYVSEYLLCLCNMCYHSGLFC